MNKKIIIILIVVFLLSSAIATFFFIKLNLNKTTANITNSTTAATTSAEVIEREIPNVNLDIDKVLANPSPKVKEKRNDISILLLGYGGAGHQGGYLSDVIMLLNINPQTKKISYIHIPRDVYLTLPIGTGVKSKINAALALGTKSTNYPTKQVPKNTIIKGSYLSKLATEIVTGIYPDYVIGIDFNNFQSAIDSIGGIDISAPRTLDDPWYPVKGRELELCGKSPEEVTALSASMSGFELEKQFPCRYERVHVPAGKNHLTGEQALKFTRSRHAAEYGGDFARGERQSIVVKAIISKLLDLKAINNTSQFFQKLSGFMKTDLTLNDIKTNTELISSLVNFSHQEISLSTNNVFSSSKASSGAYVILPKEGEDNFSGVITYINSKL